VLTVVAAFVVIHAFPSADTAHLTDGPLGDSSVTSRLMMWRSTLELWLQSPLLGHGIGSYKLLYPSVRNVLEIQSSGDLAHNDYLQFLAEGGPLLLGALLAFGVLMLVAGVGLLRGERAGPRNTERAEAIGLCMAIGVAMLHATVNFIFYITALSIVAGLFLARAYRMDTEPPLRTVPLAVRPSVSAFALCVLLTLPVIGLTLDGLSAMVLGGQSGLSLARRIEHNGHSRYKFAVLLSSLRPGNIIPWISLAQMDRGMAAAAKNRATRLKMARQTRDDYLHLLHVVEINPFALHGLAMLILHYPSVKQGLPPRYDKDPATLLVDAIKQNPQFVQPYLDLSRLLEQRGHDSAALGVLAGFFNTWLDVPGSSRVQDIRLVDRALHLAVKLHRTQAARTLAAALLQQQPHNRFARNAMANTDRQTDEGAGRRKIAPHG